MVFDRNATSHVPLSYYPQISKSNCDYDTVSLPTANGHYFFPNSSISIRTNRLFVVFVCMCLCVVIYNKLLVLASV